MRIPLTGGAYQAASLIAGAQRCVNLFPESNPQAQGEPAPVTHYLTPGLRVIGTVPRLGYRGLYTATNGALYAVVGNTLFRATSNFVFNPILALGTDTGPVSMADNGVDLCLVDGSVQGWFVALANDIPVLISDVAFYGSTRVDMIDGFFLFNRPGTAQFYLSDNLARTFDPLYIAAKAGSDQLVSIAVTRREAWLFGQRSVEIYNNTGASDFPLAAVSGGIEHGCAAAHSVAKSDGAVFWLSQSRDGRAVAMKGAQYQGKRISTHALEALWQTYGTIKDAIGYTYQQQGHIFYVLTFPAAATTWVYDLATDQWHQWQTGTSRHRGSCHAAAYGLNLIGDYGTGDLYALDPAVFTDAGVRISRVRGFPHMISDGKRVRYSSLIADMECGTVPVGAPEPIVTLRYSDDRGATWGGTQTTTLGAHGATLTSMQFQRLGMARDRVFELSWDAPVHTALQGAWVQARASGS